MKFLITVSGNQHQQNVNINYLRAQGEECLLVKLFLFLSHLAPDLPENLLTPHCHPGPSRCPACPGSLTYPPGQPPGNCPHSKDSSLNDSFTR